MSKVDSREATIKTVAEIVNHLIIAYEKNEPVNLTKLKTQISRKYKLKNMRNNGWNRNNTADGVEDNYVLASDFAKLQRQIDPISKS